MELSTRLGETVGGSGGGHYTNSEIEKLRAEAVARMEQARAEASINELLQTELVAINDRDVEFVREQLDAIEDSLRDEGLDVDRLLFGGSIAKHTYVDGLSDIDSLVILRGESEGLEPQKARERVAEALRAHLRHRDVADISVGRLAVTVTFQNGTEVQLLPAVETNARLAIASADGKRWSAINPSRFAERLTEANQRQGGLVIPTVKLAKAIFDHRLGENRPSGYHTEALAVEAFRDYVGPRTPKAMVTHFLDFASRSVLHPIVDVTGQSSHVDDSLGSPDSAARRRLSEAIGTLARVASTATSPRQWRDLLG